MQRTGPRFDSEKPRRSPRLLFWALIGALLLLAPSLWLLAAPPSERIEGRWLLEFDRDGSVQLTAERRSAGHGHWNNSSDYALKDFRGLVRPAGKTEVPARFEL